MSFFDGDGSALDSGAFGTSTFQDALTELGIRGGTKPVRYPTGIWQLDEVAGGGIPPHMLGVLGAEDGVGKSTIMLYSLLRSKVKCGAISSQDGPGLVGSRLLAYATGVQHNKIYQNELSIEEREKVIKAAERFEAEQRIAITYSSRLDKVVMDVEMMGKTGAHLVWIDYLQALVSDVHETNEFLRDLQEVCMRYPTSCMLISQLRKPGGYGDNRELISKHMLKGSGNLAQDARLILLGVNAGDKQVAVKVDKINWSRRPPYALMFNRTHSGLLEEVK